MIEVKVGGLITFFTESTWTKHILTFSISQFVYDLLTLQVNFPVFQKDDPSSNKKKKIVELFEMGGSCLSMATGSLHHFSLVLESYFYFFA